MWDALIISPFTNFLLLIYALLGHDFVIAILVFTVIFRMITFPLTAQQQKSAKAMQELQPKIKELQKKYGKEQQKLQQEQMKLMREAGVNPFGGCLPLIIQMVIFIGLYQVIMLVLAVDPLQMLNLAKQLQSPVWRGLWDLLNVSLSSLIPLNHRFLWLDLGQPDPTFLLAIVVVITTYLQQKLMTPPSADPQSRSMNQMMTLYMPIMFGIFVMSAPSGLGLYWLISNLIGIAQYWLIGPPQAATTPKPSAAPSAKSVAESPAPPAISTSVEPADKLQDKPVTMPPAGPVPHLPVKKRRRKR
jgi:YidC/Oxa1 family membrane protein insertase